MSSQQYTANEADFIRAANGTETAADSIQQITSNLEQQLSTLSHSAQYQGTQQVAFVKAHTVAQNAATRLQKDLRNLMDILNQAKAGYIHADDEAASALTTVANSGAEMSSLGHHAGAAAGGLGITGFGAGSHNI
jgi:uncharacterized protein YukE